MSLDWSLTEIKDYETLCWIAPPEGDAGQGDKVLNPVTNTIIWATMAVGIGHLTENRAEEFHDRLTFIERLFGPMSKKLDEEGKIVGLPITLDDVKAHIGLRTNVPYERNTNWAPRMLTSWQVDRQAERRRACTQEDKSA